MADTRYFKARDGDVTVTRFAGPGGARLVQLWASSDVSIYSGATLSPPEAEAIAAALVAAAHGALLDAE